MQYSKAQHRAHNMPYMSPTQIHMYIVRIHHGENSDLYIGRIKCFKAV